MCCIFSTFSWFLDAVQKTITFCVGCLIAMIMFLFVALAITTGIAYGYNYTLAEVISSKKPHVSIVLRRGKGPLVPGEKLTLLSDLEQNIAKRSDVDFNLYTRGLEDDEGVPRIELNPLSETWPKAYDTKHYAAILTKFFSEPPKDQHLRPYTYSKVSDISSSEITVATRTLESLETKTNTTTEEFREQSDILESLTEQYTGDSVTVKKRTEESTEVFEPQSRVQESLQQQQETLFTSDSPTEEFQDPTILQETREQQKIDVFTLSKPTEEFTPLTREQESIGEQTKDLFTLVEPTESFQERIQQGIPLDEQDSDENHLPTERVSLRPVYTYTETVYMGSPDIELQKHEPIHDYVDVNNKDVVETLAPDYDTRLMDRIKSNLKVWEEKFHDQREDLKWHTDKRRPKIHMRHWDQDRVNVPTVYQEYADDYSVYGKPV